MPAYGDAIQRDFDSIAVFCKIDLAAGKFLLRNVADSLLCLFGHGGSGVLTHLDTPAETSGQRAVSYGVLSGPVDWLMALGYMWRSRHTRVKGRGAEKTRVRLFTD